MKISDAYKARITLRTMDPDYGCGLEIGANLNSGSQSESLPASRWLVPHPDPRPKSRSTVRSVIPALGTSHSIFNYIDKKMFSKYLVEFPLWLFSTLPYICSTAYCECTNNHGHLGLVTVIGYLANTGVYLVYKHNYVHKNTFYRKFQIYNTTRLDMKRVRVRCRLQTT